MAVEVLCQPLSECGHLSWHLIDRTSAPPWLGLKTLWFSVPAYQRPFLMRAQRFGRPGR